MIIVVAGRLVDLKYFIELMCVTFTSGSETTHRIFSDGYIVDGKGRLGDKSAAFARPARVSPQSLAGNGQPETLEDVEGDLEGVEIGPQKLGPNGNALLFHLLDVLEHAEGQLALDFFRDAWVQTCVEGDN